jgi:hypothetical protein
MAEVWIQNPDETGLTAKVTENGALYVTSKADTLVASSPASASVGEASLSILAANSGRRGVTLVNTSANVISIAFGQDAVLYSGITLMASGGSFSSDSSSFSTAAIYAIASGAGSNLAIQEFS